MAAQKLGSEGGLGGPSVAWACLDMMELAGRLAQQHAQELKEVLRLEGYRVNQARTQLQALAQALHHILSTSTSTSDDGEERGSGGATMAMEEKRMERSTEEVSRVRGGRCSSGGPCPYTWSFRVYPGKRAANFACVIAGTVGRGPGCDGW
jgi:hypothetical protein